MSPHPSPCLTGIGHIIHVTDRQYHSLMPPSQHPHQPIINQRKGCPLPPLSTLHSSAPYPLHQITVPFFLLLVSLHHPVLTPVHLVDRFVPKRGHDRLRPAAGHRLAGQTGRRAHVFGVQDDEVRRHEQGVEVGRSFGGKGGEKRRASGWTSAGYAVGRSHAH